MANKKLALLDHLCQLMGEFGPQYSFHNPTYDGDNDSASLCFRWAGEEYIISDRGVQEND